MRLLSPMPTGSGAIVVHRQIEAQITGYRVIPYNPWWALAPPALKLIALKGADLFHTTPDYAVFCTSSKVPLVITMHNYVLDSFMRPYSTFLQRLHYRTDLRCFTRLAMARASAITAVSRFTANLAARDMGLEKPVRIIPNGIDSARFTPQAATSRADQDSIRVLVSGNLTLRKGANLLPDIAARLPRGTEIICATGLGRRHIRLASTRNIRFAGRVSYAEMPALYQSVDMLLMPTAREGLPLAVLEAMACGLPVVATDCSSLPELIDEGKGGFLCPLGDAQAFADGIAHLASAPGLRRQMGEYNRARIEKEFTLQQMISSYRSLFEEVLANQV